MSEFVFCFSDLAKSFNCFNSNIEDTICHKRAHTENVKESFIIENNNGSKLAKTIIPADRLSSSGVSRKKTIDAENRSNNQSNANPSTTIYSIAKDNSLWASSTSAQGEDSRRLKTSLPSTTKSKIIKTNFKPNIQKIAEARKYKRLAAQENEKRSPRSQVKSHIGNRLKTYENRLFKNLKNEEVKQANKIKELINMNVSSSNVGTLKDQLNKNYYDVKRKSISNLDEYSLNSFGRKMKKLK